MYVALLASGRWIAALRGAAGPAATALTAALMAGGVAIELNNTAIPESGSWVLMLLGIGAAGSAIRSQRRKTSPQLPAQ